MTPADIDAAREKLGLSALQMAAMLEVDRKTYYRWMMADDRSTRKPVPPRVYRLMAAYLAGYRPDDWPV